MLFFFALPFAYPIVYAAVYNPEVVREVPMVVVDNARTPLSRELAREMDATPNAHIVSYCADMDEAKHMMYEKHCYGILFIPEDFSRKIERGEQSVVSFYSDMSILLNYKGFLIALTDVTMNLGGKLQTQALGGATQEQINVATQPIPYSSINLYNPESGLASFLLPAILVLILQQSLILGIGMMAGGIYEHRQLHLFYSGREHMHNNVLHLVIGKSLCYFSLYILCTAYILHFIPWLFIFYIFWNDAIYICSRTRKFFLVVCLYFGYIFVHIGYYMASLCHAGVLEVVGCSHSVYLGNRRLCTYEYGRGWYL